MKARRNQVFLERRSYRLRRLGDGARMLPVLGMVLFLLPLFWAPDTAGAPRVTTGDGIYLFVVWVGLIGLSAILSRQLSHMAAAAETAVSGAGVSPDDRRAQE